jgi:hypothetical protein
MIHPSIQLFNLLSWTIELGEGIRMENVKAIDIFQ